MAVFCITRKQFLDRAFSLSELEALVEMLRLWYLARAGQEGRQGQLRIEARPYAFPRTMAEQIRRSLAERLPGAMVDASNLDEMRVSAPPVTAADGGTDLSIWREVLAEPLLQHACVLLRLTIQGPIPGHDVHPGSGTATFVICGAPANGAMLAKAIWHLRQDETMQVVYGHTQWPDEQLLLAAFETFLGQRTFGPAQSAASLAWRRFGGHARWVFIAARDDRKLMRRLRQRFELSDDRSPRAFARRLAPPLLKALGLGIIPLIFDPSIVIWLVCALGAGYQVFLAGRIMWNKLRVIRGYHARMRRGLGRLYSAPIQPAEIDLSNDFTPTLLKASAELEELGASHFCDVSIKSGSIVPMEGNRYFGLGNAIIALGLLRKTESYLLFPARPVLIVSTRFTDGRRHYTLNRPKHRKGTRSTITGRCLQTDAGVADLLSLHRRHVDRLIAAGAVPVPPPLNAAELFVRMREEHEESREAWTRSPYSWGDAIHDAFKICRREYLAD